MRMLFAWVAPRRAGEYLQPKLGQRSVLRAILVESGDGVTFGSATSQPLSLSDVRALSERRLSHLQRLEAESLHIMREVAAEFANPVMLYSIGKDSSVMLHLAMKAFYP